MTFKYYIFLWFFCFNFISCKQMSSKEEIENYKSFLISNKKQFIFLINKGFEKVNQYKDYSNAHYVFLNCEKYDRYLPLQKCDSIISQGLHELDLKEIRFERALSNCKHSIQYNSVTFLAKINGEDIIFTYNFCPIDKENNFSGKYLFYKVDEKWSIEIEK